ncbi:uncharacterized protein [Salminus brasiliensis]|uniref:uncharacterized protein n=1 Tax=Salminus brasiliensis TaxID=930266 RepID=UPI003B833844
MVENLRDFHPHVIFLQETSIGVDEELEIEGWNAFYTQYMDNEKGVAILVNKTVQFKLYSQEVDRNGRYVVVRCELLGQDYTLVSVYNHQKDTTTLDLLTPYLQKMAVGTLVIGGDFNTALEENDRAKKIPSSEDLQRYEPGKINPHQVKIKKCVKRFMRSLQLVDVFRRKNGYELFTEKCFTYKKENFLSRLDYFFLPEEWMCSVTECNIFEEQPDHSPLVLKLDTSLPKKKEKEQKQSSNTRTSKNKTALQSITQVEIVAALQSLQLRNNPSRPGRPLSKYKKLIREEIQNLKDHFNDQITNKSLLEDFNSATVATVGSTQYYFFNVEYLILATILAWRLEDWGSKNVTRTQDVETVDSPTEVQWSNLQKCKTRQSPKKG